MSPVRVATGALEAPARRALREAESSGSGHTHLGSVSQERGFLPARDPAARLPTSHEPWDETAAALPDLYRSLRLRRAVEALPLLPADPASLPDEALPRAATVLGILAHAYRRVQPLRPVDGTPDVLRVPWSQVCRRAGRPAPALSYSDLIVNNWSRSGSDAPLTVEQLRLLVPTVDNDEERRFYLTQVEMLARAAPLVGMVVRAQEAVLHDDLDALVEELHRAADCLDVLASVSLPKIDPNPWSPSHVDPVVWAKTVAPLAVPLEPGGPGPSGTSSPLFHLMDVLLERRSYSSLLGDEAVRLRAAYPVHWREFLSAVGQLSVVDHVVQRGSPAAQGALREVVERYAGDGGLLARHRLKVYGYLELAFKLGRSVTIGGFSGLFRDRTWNEVDAQIETSRSERTGVALPPAHRLAVRQVTATPLAGPGTVRQVVLHVGRSGLRYRPGDRVQVRAENDQRAVGRTLGALRARPDQPVQLTAAWAAALTTAAATAPLEDVLRIAELRPVGRPLATALLALAGDRGLRDVVRSRTESAWELWDLLELLAAGGFDPQRLWRAGVGEPEALCRLLPPGLPRTYSAASSPLAQPDELHLTVGRVEYETGEVAGANGHLRRGTASFFLTRPPPAGPQDGDRVALTVERPPRFRLPADERTPLLLFAGGTGLSPFRGFLQERALQPDAAPAWLFLSCRTRADTPYRDELEAAAATGRLVLRVALTREPDAPVTPQSRPGRLDDLLADETDARAVWDLLRSTRDGGSGASVYVCGNAGFAAEVAAGLRALVRSRVTAPAVPDPATVHRRELIATGRLVEEVYTTHLDPSRTPERLVDVSELVLHNGGPGGLWTAVADRVYDIGDFVDEHPGGAALLKGYAGMDATAAYEQVGHSSRPDVSAHLPRYEIGTLRPLDLGREWGVVVTASGLRTVTLAEAHRTWVQALFLAVELQNAFANDRSISALATTRGDRGLPDAYGSQLAIDVHARFLSEYVAGLTGAPLEELWAVTSGLCAPREDVRRLPDLLLAVQSSPAATIAVRSPELLLAGLDRLLDRPGPAGWEGLDAVCRRLHERDARLLEDVKLALRGGVRVFEELQDQTARRGASRLLAAVLEPVDLLQAYLDDVGQVGGLLPTA